MLWIALQAQAAPELHPVHIRRCGEPPEAMELYRAEVTLGDLGLPAGEGVDKTLPVSVLSERPSLGGETWAEAAQGAAIDLGYRVRRGEIRARHRRKGQDLSGVSILVRADGAVERFPAERSLAPYIALFPLQSAPAGDAGAPLPDDLFAGEVGGSDIERLHAMFAAFSWSPRLPELCDALAARTGRLLLLDASASLRWTFSSTGQVSADGMIEILGALLPAAGLSMRQDGAAALIEGEPPRGEAPFLVALFETGARLDESAPESVRATHIELSGGLLRVHDLSKSPVALRPSRAGPPQRFGAWPAASRVAVGASDRCRSEPLRAVPRRGPSGEPDGIRLVLTEPGGLYERIGLQNGDILYLVDGAEAREPLDAGALLEQAIAAPGEHTLLVERRSEPLEIALDVPQGPDCEPRHR